MSEALLFERDVAIRVRDGTILRANVYRPSSSDRSPVSGRPRSHGVLETSGCSASPTMHSPSGRWRRYSHPT